LRHSGSAESKILHEMRRCIRRPAKRADRSGCSCRACCANRAVAASTDSAASSCASARTCTSVGIRTGNGNGNHACDS